MIYATREIAQDVERGFVPNTVVKETRQIVVGQRLSAKRTPVNRSLRLQRRSAA